MRRFLASACVVLGTLSVWHGGAVNAQSICGAANPGKTMRKAGGSGGGFQLVGDVNRRWKDRDRITVRLYTRDRKLHDLVVAYAGDWGRYANLYLDFGNHRSADVRVTFNPGGGHWSKIGTDAKKTPANQPTMNLALTSRSSRSEIRRVVLHEFGHAMGFIHEHQNPRGGIRWDRPKVYRYFKQTQGWDKAKVDHNIFREYSRDSVNASRFDKKSIMLYSFPKELTTDGSSTSWNTRLSDLDKRHAARLYPWTPHSLVRIRNGVKSGVAFSYKWEGSTKWKRLSTSDRRLKSGGRQDLWKNAGRERKYRDLVVRFDDGKGKTRQFRLKTTAWRPRGVGDYPSFTGAQSYVFRVRNGALSIYRERQ